MQRSGVLAFWRSGVHFRCRFLRSHRRSVAEVSAGIVISVVVVLASLPFAEPVAAASNEIRLAKSGWLVVEGQVTNPDAQWTSNLYTDLPVSATICEPCTQTSQGGVVGWYEAGTEVVVKMYVQDTDSWKYSWNSDHAEVTVDPSDPNVFHIAFEDGGGPPGGDVTVSVASTEFPSPTMRALARGKPPWVEPAADPVNTLTGNFFHELSDLAPPDGVWGPSWSRMYNSDDDGSKLAATGEAGLVGAGWSTPFDVSLEAIEGTTRQLEWRGPEGQLVRFLRDESSEEWIVPEGIGAVLSATSTGYDMAFVDGSVWSFDDQGVLTTIANADGNQVVLTYSSSAMLTKATYTNSAGTAWELTFVDSNADFLVDSVIATGGRTVQYSYTSGRLTSASGPYLSGETPGGETYVYDGSGRMTDLYVAVHPEAPLHTLHNDFDAFGRVSHQWMVGGDEADFDYSSLDEQDQWITTVTHEGQGVAAEELSFVYSSDGRIAEVRSVDTGFVAKGWDRDRLSSFTSRRGALHTTQFDASLRPTTVLLPSPEVPSMTSGAIDFEWCNSDPTDTRIKSSTDAAGLVTRYWYDPDDTGVQCVVGVTRPTKIVTGVGTGLEQTVHKSWDGELLTSITDAFGVTSTYTWDTALRRLLSSTTAVGTTYFGYDAVGNRIVVRDPSGVETWSMFDGAGRITSTTGPVAVDRSCSPSSCSFGFNPPVGPTETMQYWLDGSLRSRTDADGFSWQYARTWLDEGGWADITVDPDSMWWASIYDAAGRMIAEWEPGDDADPEGSSTATTYQYGPLGRLMRETDPTGRQTHYCYDADANVTLSATGTLADNEVIDCGSPQANLAVTRTDYDLRGRVTRVTDPTGRQTHTLYDAANRVTEVRGPADPTLVANEGEWPTTTYGYDNLGRPTTTTTAGRTLSTTYVAASTTLPRHDVTTDASTGLVTVVVYDANRRVVERRGPHLDAANLTNPAVPATTYEYDTNGRLFKTVAPDGETTETTAFDAAGRALEVVDPAGVVTTYEYSLRGDLLSATTASGTDDETSVEYSDIGFDGQPGVVRDGNANVTSFDYNARRERIARTNADSVVEHWAYDTAGRLISHTDGLDRTTTRTYDEHGRLDVVVDAAGYTTDYDWFANGAIASATGRDSQSTRTRTYTYDAFARRHRVEDSWSGVVEFDYDEAGRLISRNDGGDNDRVWHWSYDTAGRLISSSSPDVTTLVRQYDPDTGLLASIRPAQIIADSFSLSDWWAPSRYNWTVTKSGCAPTPTNGVLELRCDEAGSTTLGANSGDIADASVLATVRFTQGSASLSIDQRVNASDAYRLQLDSDTARLYAVEDGVPRLLDETGLDAGVHNVRFETTGSTIHAHIWAPDQSEATTWSLEATDTSITDPGAISFEMAGDSGSALSIDDIAITDTNGPLDALVRYERDRSGRVTREILPGGDEREWTYSNGRVVSMTQDIDGAPQSYALTYDNAGRVATKTADGVVSTYAYDRAGQLTGATTPGRDELTYTYDAIGRRTTATIGENTTTYTYDDAGQLISTGDGETYTYDGAGRRISVSHASGPNDEYLYDPFGQLIGSTQSGLRVAEPDAVGFFALIAGDGARIEFDAGSPTAPPATITEVNDVFGDGPHHADTTVIVGDGASVSAIKQGGEQFALALDVDGSVLATNNTHSVTQAHAYDPYGQPDVTNAAGRVTLGYRGELTTGDLVYLRNRDYDPEIGSFTTRDPLDGVDGTPTVANPYHYADNDPVNKVDPLGLRPGDESFDVCLDPDESQVLNPGELQDFSYDLGSFTALSEWTAQVINCAKGQVNEGYDRTGGGFGEKAGCLAAIGSSVLTGELSPWSLQRACDAAQFWADFSFEASRDLSDPDRIGERNAVRHFVWSAIIAYEAGYDAAIAVTGVHEELGLSCPGTRRECEWDIKADRTNNGLGATWGQVMKGTWGNRWNCASPSNEFGCSGYHGNHLREAVRSAARNQLQAGALDLRGGCPSTARWVIEGC